MKALTLASSFVSVVSAAAIVIACSSSDSSTSSSSGNGGSSSGSSGSSGSSSGSSGSSGSSSGSSGSSSGSSGSSSGSSGSSGCELFTCTDTGDCGGIAPCMSTSTGTNYCYEQEASADACSEGTTATTKMVDGSSRTLCVPAGCPEPDTYLPPQ